MEYSRYHKAWTTQTDEDSLANISHIKAKHESAYAAYVLEKLYHLNAKTREEARTIVAKSPMTNEGFQAAWENLTARYENSRLLVMTQARQLLQIPAVAQESGKLRELQTAFQGSFTALERSGEQSVPKKTVVSTWYDFNQFLTDRYRVLDATEKHKSVPSVQAIPIGPRKSSATMKVQAFPAKAQLKPASCKLFHRENHPIRLCPSFLDMPVQMRLETIRQQGLCLNCFARGHQVKGCFSAHNCHTCNERHHALLHPIDVSGSSPSAAQVPPFGATERPFTSNQLTNAQSYFASTPGRGFLGTAIVILHHRGVEHHIRALIDSGADSTFLSERVFNMVQPPFIQ
ncbi:uncharacterized protein [Drosophila tropicalis]|uniref:uncharacterized protein n=1 Tax=Drosophila tropicalis TaxID=46794 RepID=UPI0035AC0310